VPDSRCNPYCQTLPAIHLPRTARLWEWVTLSRLRSVCSEGSGGVLPETVDGILDKQGLEGLEALRLEQIGPLKGRRIVRGREAEGDQRAGTSSTGMT